MIKWLIILLLCSCTATKTTFVVNASHSYITGGDGHGYFTSWQLLRNGVNLGHNKPIDTITVQGKGTFTYIYIITTNTGKTATDTYTITAK